MAVATPERLSLAEDVAKLRAAGLTHQQVADALGISRSYASHLASDPDGSKQAKRRQRHRKTCPRCGTLMDGSHGFGPKAPQLCDACSRAKRSEDRYWTPDTIVASFQAFAKQNGRAPTTVDKMIGQPSIRAKLTDERVLETELFSTAPSDLPHPRIVQRECGSWDNALLLAGLPANPQGGAARRTRRDRKDPSVKTYIVLAGTGSNWTEAGRTDARTPNEAIANVAKDADYEYVAIPVTAWLPCRVQPVTSLQVVV